MTQKSSREQSEPVTLVASQVKPALQKLCATQSPVLKQWFSSATDAAFWGVQTLFEHRPLVH